MNHEKQIPKIRFKGFNDAWEQRKFRDTVIIERGGSPRPIETFITEAKNGLNWVKIGDAPTMGNYITKTAEKIRPEGLSKTREVHPGDLLLSNSMSFGKPYIMGINGCIHDGWLLIRNEKQVYDLTFLCHLLGTQQMLAQYKSLAAGSTVNNLNKELVGSTVVSYPPMQEQIAIGAYLTLFDNLITLHQRKCETLKNVKKSFLKKLFPKNGAVFPDLRFSGFTNAWEQRELGEVYRKIRNAFVGTASPYYVESGHFYLESNNIKDGQINRNNEIFINEDFYQKQKEKWLHTDDIVMVQSGHVGHSAVIPRELNNSVAHALIVMSDPVGKTNPHFYNYQFQTSTSKKKICDITTGNTIKHILSSDMKVFEVFTSTYSEQEKISALFSTLDNLITLHQRKCEALKNIKKSLLSKMFV